MRILILNPIKAFLDPSGSFTVHNWRALKHGIARLLNSNHEVRQRTMERISSPIEADLNAYDRRPLFDIAAAPIGWRPDAICGAPWQEVLKLPGMIIKDCLGHYSDLSLPPRRYILLSEVLSEQI